LREADPFSFHPGPEPPLQVKSYVNLR